MSYIWQRPKPFGKRNFQEEGTANEELQGEIEHDMRGPVWQDQCVKSNNQEPDSIGFWRPGDKVCILLTNWHIDQNY